MLMWGEVNIKKFSQTILSICLTSAAGSEVKLYPNISRVQITVIENGKVFLMSVTSPFKRKGLVGALS